MSKARSPRLVCSMTIGTRVFMRGSKSFITVLGSTVCRAGKRFPALTLATTLLGLVAFARLGLFGLGRRLLRRRRPLGGLLRFFALARSVRIPQRSGGAWWRESVWQYGIDSGVAVS